jgi:iron complex outermembrane receptor protein
MDYLRHKFNLGIDMRIYKKLGANLAFSYSDRNGAYSNFADGQEKNYKGFTTTDVKLFWRPLNFDIYLNCNNIFDARYFDFGNIEMPGLWISSGVNYKFDFSKKTKKHG